jgi:hypothetical protein
MIAEENVPAGRHEIDAVHVHSGWRRAFAVRLDDVAVDAPGVQIVSQVDRGDTDNDDPEAVHGSAPYERVYGHATICLENQGALIRVNPRKYCIAEEDCENPIGK